MFGCAPGRSTGIPLMVGPCGPNGPFITGAPLLLPLSSFIWFKTEVSFCPAVEKSETWLTVVLYV